MLEHNPTNVTVFANGISSISPAFKEVIEKALGVPMTPDKIQKEMNKSGNSTFKDAYIAICLFQAYLFAMNIDIELRAVESLRQEALELDKILREKSDAPIRHPAVIEAQLELFKLYTTAIDLHFQQDANILLSFAHFKSTMLEHNYQKMVPLLAAHHQLMHHSINEFAAAPQHIQSLRTGTPAQQKQADKLATLYNNFQTRLKTPIHQRCQAHVQNNAAAFPAHTVNTEMQNRYANKTHLSSTEKTEFLAHRERMDHEMIKAVEIINKSDEYLLTRFNERLAQIQVVAVSVKTNPVEVIPPSQKLSEKIGLSKEGLATVKSSEKTVCTSSDAEVIDVIKNTILSSLENCYLKNSGSQQQIDHLSKSLQALGLKSADNRPLQEKVADVHKAFKNIDWKIIDDIEDVKELVDDLNKLECFKDNSLSYPDHPHEP